MEKNGINILKLHDPVISKEMNFIDDDFMIFDNIDNVPLYNYPSHIYTIIIAICLKGSLKISINLKEYTVEPNTLIVLLPDETVQLFEKSDDFSGMFIGLSRHFMDESIPATSKLLKAFFYVRNHPCTPISIDEIECISDYHSMIRKKLRISDLYYKKEIVRSLALSLFYELCAIFDKHKIEEIEESPRKEEIFRLFMNELRLNYKKERTIGFYADRLCMSAKYLSIIVKKASGKTAAEWIEEYVILESKMLLKSTSMTIQEISDSLNFANQSFFGKYFKHYTGLSPRAYRTSK